MIYVKHMFHTCLESEKVLRTIEWDRGKWICGISVVLKCPCCKEKLPQAKELNQIHTEPSLWVGKGNRVYNYDVPILSIKPIVKRKRKIHTYHNKQRAK